MGEDAPGFFFSSRYCANLDYHAEFYKHIELGGEKAISKLQRKSFYKGEVSAQKKK